MNLIKECEHFDNMARKRRINRRFEVFIVVGFTILGCLWAYTVLGAFV